MKLCCVLNAAIKMPRMRLVGFFLGVGGTVSHRGTATGCLNGVVRFASIDLFSPSDFSFVKSD